MALKVKLIRKTYILRNFSNRLCTLVSALWESPEKIYNACGSTLHKGIFSKFYYYYPKDGIFKNEKAEKKKMKNRNIA